MSEIESSFQALALASGMGRMSIMFNGDAFGVALRSFNPKLINSQIPGVAERTERCLRALPVISEALFGWWRP